MTMHLVGPALSTTVERRRRKVLPEARLKSKYEYDWRSYNREMTRLGSKCKSFEEYVEYREGRAKLKQRRRVDPMKPGTYTRRSPDVPSGDGVAHVGGKEPKTYTGSYIKGIGQMHKSNAVPITNSEQAVDIARMRRN